MRVGINRAEMFNEVNRAMQISRASEIQNTQGRFWGCLLHCCLLSHYAPNISFFSSASKNQFDVTASSLKLAWFNLWYRKNLSHGKGPSGKSNDSIFPRESCHLRLCPCRRESEQLQCILYKMCVHVYGDMTQCFVAAHFILGSSHDRWNDFCDYS